MTFTEVAVLIFTLLALAIAVWTGDNLIALLPGSDRIKRAVRIVAIAALAFWLLGQAASLLGVAVPWSSTAHHRR